MSAIVSLGNITPQINFPTVTGMHHVRRMRGGSQFQPAGMEASSFLASDMRSSPFPG